MEIGGPLLVRKVRSQFSRKVGPPISGGLKTQALGTKDLAFNASPTCFLVRGRLRGSFVSSALLQPSKQQRLGPVLQAFPLGRSTKPGKWPSEGGRWLKAGQH